MKAQADAVADNLYPLKMKDILKPLRPIHAKSTSVCLKNCNSLKLLISGSGITQAS